MMSTIIMTEMADMVQKIEAFVVDTVAIDGTEGNLFMPIANTGEIVPAEMATVPTIIVPKKDTVHAALAEDSEILEMITGIEVPKDGIS